MPRLLIRLRDDEAGFVISSELVLVATIAVLSMIVGLSAISYAVNQELDDVASAYDAVNQYGGRSRDRDRRYGGDYGDFSGSLGSSPPQGEF
jgi:hypothetical protein